MQIGNSSAKRTHLIAIASGILVIICAAALYILYREANKQRTGIRQNVWQ